MSACFVFLFVGHVDWLATFQPLLHQYLWLVWTCALYKFRCNNIINTDLKTWALVVYSCKTRNGFFLCWSYGKRQCFVRTLQCIDVALPIAFCYRYHFILKTISSCLRATLSCATCLASTDSVSEFHRMHSTFVDLLTDVLFILCGSGMKLWRRKGCLGSTGYHLSPL